MCEGGDLSNRSDVSVPAVKGMADSGKPLNGDHYLRIGLLCVQELEGNWLIEDPRRVVLQESR